MARHLVAASLQYLWRTGVPVAAAPLTVSLWAQTSTPAQATVPCASLCHGTVNGWYFVGTSSSASAPQAYEFDGTSVGQAVAAAPIASTWTHLCGVFTSQSARACFVNGANKVSDGTSLVAPGLDRLMVGGLYLGAALWTTFDGDLAEVAVWNAALSDAEVAQLATGLAASAVRAGNLVAYYPLLGTSSPEPDVMGGTALTLVNGPTAATHPPIHTSSGAGGRMFQVF